MQNRSALTINRYYSTDRCWVWWPILVCLIVLSSKMAVGSDGQESMAGSCWHTSGFLVDGLAGPGESADAAFLTADKNNTASSGRLFFSSPAETETPYVETVIPGNSKFSAPATHHAVMMPKASSLIKGISVPLYLAHQSLLC